MACGDSALEAGNRRRSTSSDADAERFHVDMDLGPVVIEAFTSIFPLLYALYYADRKLKATKAHLGGVGPLGSWSNVCWHCLLPSLESRFFLRLLSLSPLLRSVSLSFSFSLSNLEFESSPTPTLSLLHADCDYCCSTRKAETGERVFPQLL